MNPLLKQFLIIAGIVLSILAIIFGSYLPFRKAQLYINALRTAREIKTVGEFKDHFDKVFNFYSPVGGEEVVKFLANDIANLLNQTRENESVARAILNYIEPRFFQNNVRHLLVGAELYGTLWNNYHRAEDAARAEAYYLAVLKIGPKLPPALYGLLSLYQSTGNAQKAKVVAEEILKYWPEDERVKEILKTL